jgi:hypothetical protein
LADHIKGRWWNERGIWRSWEISEIKKKIVEENVGKKLVGRPKRRFECNI